MFDFELVHETNRNCAFEVRETTSVRDVLIADATEYGTYIFLEFCHRYLCILVIKDRTPEHIIEDATRCSMKITVMMHEVYVM